MLIFSMALTTHGIFSSFFYTNKISLKEAEIQYHHYSENDRKICVKEMPVWKLETCYTTFKWQDKQKIEQIIAFLFVCFDFAFFQRFLIKPENNRNVVSTKRLYKCSKSTKSFFFQYDHWKLKQTIAIGIFKSILWII